MTRTPDHQPNRNIQTEPGVILLICPSGEDMLLRLLRLFELFSHSHSHAALQKELQGRQSSRAVNTQGPSSVMATECSQ
jgi:hypothetical protein